MADKTSTTEIEAKATLAPNFERLEKLMLSPQPFVVDVKADVKNGFGGQGYAAQPPGFAGAMPGSPTNRQLETQVQRSTLQYQTKDFPKFVKNMGTFSTELTQQTNKMWPLGRALIGLGAGRGVVGAAAGAFYALSRDAASKGRFAAGVGSTVGGVAADETFLSRFGDVSSQLAAISRAQTGPGAERRAVYALGLGEKLNEDSGKLLGDVTQAWANRLKNIP
jgi:hypothetical protein